MELKSMECGGAFDAGRTKCCKDKDGSQVAGQDAWVVVSCTRPGLREEGTWAEASHNGNCSWSRVLVGGRRMETHRDIHFQRKAVRGSVTEDMKSFSFLTCYSIPSSIYLSKTLTPDPNKSRSNARPVKFGTRIESPSPVSPLDGTDSGVSQVLLRQMQQPNVRVAAVTLLATLLMNPLESQAFFLLSLARMKVC